MSVVFFKKKDPADKAVVRFGAPLKNGKQVWVESPSGGREQRFYSTARRAEKIPWEQCFMKTVSELREIDLIAGRRHIRHVKGEHVSPVEKLSFQEHLDLAMFQERGKLPEGETAPPPTQRTEAVRGWGRQKLDAGILGDPAYG